MHCLGRREVNGSLSTTARSQACKTVGHSCSRLTRWLDGESWEDAMVEIIEILREEHRNIEKLLVAMEHELSVFDRGERPDYDVFEAIIGFFKMYPDTCHHPKEDII